MENIKRAKEEKERRRRRKEKEKRKEKEYQTPKKSGKGLKCKCKGGLTFPRLSENRPKVINEMLQKYGNYNIEFIQVGKKQLRPILEKLANITTLGYYEKKKKELGIDKYFHIYLILYLDNNKTIVLEKNIKLVLEKNHRVGWKHYIPSTNEQLLDVRINKPIKLYHFIENGERYAGNERIYIYDATKANCQVYVKDMLLGNGIWNKQLEKFVIQDVS